jgi:hypothetical protein
MAARYAASATETAGPPWLAVWRETAAASDAVEGASPAPCAVCKGDDDDGGAGAATAPAAAAAASLLPRVRKEAMGLGGGRRRRPAASISSSRRNASCCCWWCHVRYEHPTKPNGTGGTL